MGTMIISPYRFVVPDALDITLDASVNGGGTTLGNKTFSVTVASNNNRILLVWAGGGGATLTVTSITYNGVNLSKLGEATSGSPYYSDVELWYLIAPAIGTNNVVITQSGNTNMTGWAVSLYGAKQSAPTIFNTTSGRSSSVATTLTPTVAGDWMLTAGWGDSQSATNQPFNLTVPSGTYGAYHKTPTIGSSNSITFTLASSQPYGAVAVVISKI